MIDKLHKGRKKITQTHLTPSAWSTGNKGIPREFIKGAQMTLGVMQCGGKNASKKQVNPDIMTPNDRKWVSDDTQKTLRNTLVFIKRTESVLTSNRTTADASLSVSLKGSDCVSY